MYRAVTLYVLEHNISLEDALAIEDALNLIQISFSHIDGQQTTLLNGIDVDQRIRAADVNQLVSPVAAISAVRRHLVKQQQALGAEGCIVMDGRDIGTVVFPDAELKIFLTADTDVRIERRYAELRTLGLNMTREEVAASLANRDQIDSTREDSPLRQADDAIVIDNTHLDRESQFLNALDLAKTAIARAGIRSS
jgi:cytidylate kinase